MKNPSIKLTAEQRAIIDLLCEHDLYTSSTSGEDDVILGCRECPATASRSATSRRSDIEWNDETTPSVTLVRVLNAWDQHGGHGDDPEDWQDSSECLIVTHDRIQRKYGIGTRSAKARVIDFDELHEAAEIGMSSADLAETSTALNELADWIERVDCHSRTYHDLIVRRDELFDIGDFGPALAEVDEDLWDVLRGLLDQCMFENDEGVCPLIAEKDLAALPKTHEAYKAAFYLALQSCIDAEWTCATDGSFHFFDHLSTRLANEVADADLDGKIAALKFTEEWAVLGFYILDHSGISLSTGRQCRWDSSFAGYVCEKLREGETMEAATKRALHMLNVMDAHYRGQYTYHQVQTLTLYRPSDLDNEDWEDGDSCGGHLFVEWAERDDAAKEALDCEVKHLRKEGKIVINLGVIDVD